MKKDSAEKILNLLSLDELMRLHTNYETNDDRLYQGFDTLEFEPVVKLFNPVGVGTWYLSELDDNNIGFGICYLGKYELGYVALQELGALELPLKAKIEKDLFFCSHGLTLSQLCKQLKASEESF